MFNSRSQTNFSPEFEFKKNEININLNQFLHQFKPNLVDI